MPQKGGEGVRQQKASNLIVQAYGLGAAHALALRVVNDARELDVAVGPVLGESVAQDMAILRSAAKRIQDRVERAQIDNVKAVQRQRQEGRE